MNAKELLHRYLEGERNFCNADLRSLDLRSLDLTGANFSGADIRSTNFERAILHSANFTGAKGGRTALQNLISLLLASLLAIATAFSQLRLWLQLIVAAYSLSQDEIDSFALHWPENNSSLFLLLGYVLIVIGVIFGVTFWQGITGRGLCICGAVVAAFAALIWLPPLQTALLAISQKTTANWPANVATALTMTSLAIMTISETLLAIALFGIIIFANGVKVLIGALAVAISLMTIPVWLFANAFFSPQNDVPNYGGAVFSFWFVIAAIVIFIAVLLTLSISISAGLWVSQRARLGDPKFALIRNSGLRLKVVGSTSFRGANLTATTFDRAIIAGVDFSSLRQQATLLSYSSLQNARQLDEAAFRHSLLDKKIAEQQRNKPYY